MIVRHAFFLVAVTIGALQLSGTECLAQTDSIQPEPEEPRVWTAGGGKTVRAVMAGVEGDGVRLKLEDGRVLTPPLSQLSDADRLYVFRRITPMVVESLLKSTQGTAEIPSDASIWPARIAAPEPDVLIEELDKQNGASRFRTRSFDWSSDLDLNPQTKQDLARFLEGSMTLFRHLPGNLAETTEEAGGRFKVSLFENAASMAKATGRPSRGVTYDFESKTLGCVFEAAGVTKNGSEMFRDSGHQSEELRDELTLMVLDRSGINYLPPWVVFGISEYVASVPQISGVFLGDRVLEKFKLAESAQTASYEAIPSILPMSNREWNAEAKNSSTARDAMKQASMLLVHYLAKEESAAFEEMLDRAAELGPKWDDYFAKVKVYREAMEVLKKRPDVEFREDGRFRLPAGEIAPTSPAAPGESNPNLLPEQHTAIATGGKSPAELAAAVKKSVETLLQKTPAPVTGLSANSERTWTDAQGRSMKAVLRGFESGEAIFANAKQPIRIPLAKLSAGDQEFIALHIADLVDTNVSAAGLGSVAVESARRWPSKLSAPNGLTNADYDQQNSKPGRHLYRTRYFEYIVHAELPLSPTVMKDIARVFEGTRELLSQSPWGVQAQPDDGAFKAELWKTREEYIRAGGPSNSSGVYLIREKRFLVPFESLGLKATGSSYIKASNYEIKTLVHELTHMMMHDIIASLPIWMVEGTAEYTEAIPLRNYEFHCSRIAEGAKAVNKRYFELRSQQGFQGILDFAELIEISRTNWNHKVMGTSPKPKPATTRTVGFDLTGLIGGGMTGGPQGDPLMQAALYQSSLLLTYYFMNLDGEGKGSRVLKMLAAARRDKPKWDAYEAAFKKYDRDIREFMKRPEVEKLPDGSFKYPAFLTPPESPEPPVAISEDGDAGLAHVDLLLDGRTPAQLATEAKAALRKDGFFLE